MLSEAGKAAQELDVSKLTPEALQSKFTGLAGQISQQLQAITDKVSATDVAAKLEPMVDQLSRLKVQLGDKLPSLDSVSKAIAGLQTKFAGDPAVLDVLEPLLQKLQALLQ